MGMDVVAQDGAATYLRGWGDYQPWSLKLIASDTSGMGVLGLRTWSPEALERRVSLTEESYERLAYEVWRNQGGRAYVILDAAAMRLDAVRELYTTQLPPLAAMSVAELEQLIDVPTGSLERTITDFNAACSDREVDLNRLDGAGTIGLTPPKSNWAAPIAEPPFRAFPATVGIGFPLGGLRVDTGGRVLSDSGEAIERLYAAGEIVGWFFNEYGPVDSVSVLNAMSLGRVVGERVGSGG